MQHTADQLPTPFFKLLAKEPITRCTLHEGGPWVARSGRNGRCSKFVVTKIIEVLVYYSRVYMTPFKSIKKVFLCFSCSIWYNKCNMYTYADIYPSTWLYPPLHPNPHSFHKMAQRKALLHHITSHDSTWHHMTWHDMTWHDMASHHITSHHITSTSILKTSV